MKTLTVFFITPLLFLLTSLNFQKPESIYQNIVHRPFSDPILNDTFSIKIVGNSILSGSVIISITNHKGMEIFNENYPASYLIGYGLIEKQSTIKIKEEYIKKRVDEFFINDKFFSPAISNDEQFDQDYSESEPWDDIKSDSTAIGFYYLIGEEAGCRIAYSKEEKKVLKYFCCC